FSSRRRHTRFSRDWSSDVCSSDLTQEYIHIFFDEIASPFGFFRQRSKTFYQSVCDKTQQPEDDKRNNSQPYLSFVMAKIKVHKFRCFLIRKSVFRSVIRPHYYMSQ